MIMRAKCFREFPTMQQIFEKLICTNLTAKIDKIDVLKIMK